jgi:competence protein ComEA
MQANEENWRSRAATGLKSISEAASSITRFQACTLAVLLLLLIGGAFLSYQRSRPKIVRVLEKKQTSAGEGEDTQRPSGAELTVHVAGAVSRPGLYRVSEGSRVADALTKAGGPAPDALLDNLNLAAKLKDGEKVLVPRQSSAAAADGADPGNAISSSGSTGNMINVNLASIDELDKLPGVGPALARRIVEYRQKNGAFSSIEELDNVEGIGPAKLESIKDQVTI